MEASPCDAGAGDEAGYGTIWTANFGLWRSGRRAAASAGRGAADREMRPTTASYFGGTLEGRVQGC